MKSEIIYKTTGLFQYQKEPVCFVWVEEQDSLLYGDLLADWDQSAIFKSAERLAKQTLKCRKVEWLASCPSWDAGIGWLQFRKKNFPRTTWMKIYKNKENQSFKGCLINLKNKL